MKNLKLFGIALCSIIGFVANAQEDPLYTQYMYNSININPAYAGSRGALSIFGVHRAQWVGLEGAPSTTAFSAHTPIKDSKVGVGLSFLNTNLGASNDNTIAIDVSYTLDFGRSRKLSFGLKGTANILNVDYTKLLHYNPNDPRFQQNIENKFTPNFGLGLYYHTDKGYVGISAPSILSTTRYNDNDNIKSTSVEKSSFYAIGGYVFDIDTNLKFKPAALVKLLPTGTLQTDVSANFLLYDKFTVGGAYRINQALSALVGFQITEGLFIGYSYDGDTQALKNYSSGSHEIFLRFELFTKTNRVISSRFF